MASLEIISFSSLEGFTPLYGVSIMIILSPVSKLTIDAFFIHVIIIVSLPNVLVNRNFFMDRPGKIDFKYHFGELSYMKYVLHMLLTCYFGDNICYRNVSLPTFIQVVQEYSYWWVEYIQKMSL